MRLALVHCPNPSCRLIYETALDPGEWHAKCPDCKQQNRVPGTAAGKDITGICEACKQPLDHLHIFGRGVYACPPESERSFK